MNPAIPDCLHRHDETIMTALKVLTTLSNVEFEVAGNRYKADFQATTFSTRLRRYHTVPSCLTETLITVTTKTVLIESPPLSANLVFRSFLASATTSLPVLANSYSRHVEPLGSIIDHIADISLLWWLY